MTEQGRNDATGGTNGAHDNPTRQEIIDGVATAMTRLRAAIDELRGEVEANAQTEWVRAKPELRSTIADLEGMVEALAQRAKSALASIDARLDPKEEQEEDRPS